MVAVQALFHELSIIPDMKFDTTESFAKELDNQDPLQEFRNRFIIPVREGIEQIYFLGNSLGLQPRSLRAELDEVLKKWSDYGVEAFFHGASPWMQMHAGLTAPLAKIVGAKPAEVVVMNQLSVNLHLMLVSFYRPVGKRRKILCEQKAFPSDQYVLETYLKHLGVDPAEIIVEVAPAPGSYLINEEDILLAIDNNRDELALVFWGGVNYYTGQVFDAGRITRAAHEAGAIAGFDLAHAAGNVKLSLHEWDVDFACWCSYKYLNSGPGAVGGAFIHERYHRDAGIERLAGWWGYDEKSRFQMLPGFKPIQSAEGWQLSTPSILLYASHKAALDLFEEAGMERVIEKSKLLSDYLFYLMTDLAGHVGKQKLELITPAEQAYRGSQLSMMVRTDGRRVFDSLSVAGIFADWREPDVIRVAPVPLYNTYSEVHHFYLAMKKILS